MAIPTQGPGFLAHEFMGAAGKQEVGRPLGKDEHVLLLFGVRLNRRHELSLGRKGDFADAREAPIERLMGQASLAGCDDKRSFGGIAVHHPAPIALIQHGIACPVGDRQCAFHFDAQPI